MTWQNVLIYFVVGPCLVFFFILGLMSLITPGSSTNVLIAGLSPFIGIAVGMIAAIIWPTSDTE